MLQLSRLLFQGHLSAVGETEVNCLLVEFTSLNYDNSHNRQIESLPVTPMGYLHFKKLFLEPCGNSFLQVG